MSASNKAVIGAHLLIAGFAFYQAVVTAAKLVADQRPPAPETMRFRNRHRHQQLV